MLLVFSEDNVPTWEVRRKAKQGGGGSSDLVVGGAADTFEAAKERRCLKRRPGPQNDGTV
jgi:hypothetical protein